MSSTTEEPNTKEETPQETESTAEFTPVVQLQKVDVKTHEEEETVLYEERAKLYLYGESILNKGTGTKTWNERGVGQLKLLKHNTHNKIRILMRQEKTMKVIANHIISPTLELTPHESSETSWIWAAMDYADGSMEEKVFCVRVKDVEKAARFKAMMDMAKEHMKVLKEGGDLSTLPTATLNASSSSNESTEQADETKEAETTTTTTTESAEEGLAESLTSLTVTEGGESTEETTTTTTTEETSS
jgi:Ran-binding protein 1